jgi:glycosyltransferase involved in cell wall biosynthesis
MAKFSIITPCYIGNDEKGQQREKDLERAIRSVQSQTCQDYEHIIVDDGSPRPIGKGDDRTRVFRVPHLERVVAYTKGFEEAKGDWFCLLDSDDEYISHYLEAINEAIRVYPESKLFNFGSIFIHTDYGVHLRGGFAPRKEKVGHEVFGGGNIVNGTFVWHRSLYDELGAFPTSGKVWNPWDFSMIAQGEFPEIRQFFRSKHPDHPEGLARELGNPWGQDFFLFYKYTRKYHSQLLDAYIYIVHNKGKKEIIRKP